MEFKTKFNLGDSVYLMFDNKVIKCTITHIFINYYERIEINYKLNIINGPSIDRLEGLLFNTKDELLKSI